MKQTLDLTFGFLLILAFGLFIAPMFGLPEWCFWAGFAPTIIAVMVHFSNSENNDDNDDVYNHPHRYQP